MTDNTRLEAFERQRLILEKIWKDGMQSYLFQCIKEGHITDVFGKECREHHGACCIDEGMRGGVIRIAPLKSGGADWNESVLITAQVMIKAGAKSISSHANCGAVALYCRENRIITDDMPAVEASAIVNAFAKQFALNVVEKVHKLAPMMPFKYFGHIGEEDMLRPKDFHDAMVICVSGSEFNDSAPVFPSMIQIHAKHIEILEMEKIIGVLNTAIGIVMGKSGMGSIICEKRPLTIVPISGDTLPLQTLVSYIENFVDQSVFRDVIKISPLDPQRLPIKNGVIAV